MTKTAKDMLHATDVHWVVTDDGELAVEISGQVFLLYKGHSLETLNLEKDKGTENMGSYRPVEKREFGETVELRLDEFKKRNEGYGPDDWKPFPTAG